MFLLSEEQIEMFFFFFVKKCNLVTVSKFQGNDKRKSIEILPIYSQGEAEEKLVTAAWPRR